VSEEYGHGQRIAAVETEVATIRSEMGGIKSEMGVVKADVRGLGAILNRIETGILRAQEQQDHKEQLSKPNLVAMVSVLITIMSILVGGAWLISGSLSRQDEALHRVGADVQRIEQRQWGLHGRPSSQK
jgi:hypothetical protein